MIKGNKFAAMNRAARRGQPLAQKALEVVNEEVAAFVARCNQNKLVVPSEKVLSEALTEIVVQASPWLQNAIDGRKNRHQKVA